MDADSVRYSGYRYPRQISGHAVWLYHRFCLSFRDVDCRLNEGPLSPTRRSGSGVANLGRRTRERRKGREGRLGDTWYLDEVFVAVHG
jgi:putative transposase